MSKELETDPGQSKAETKKKTHPNPSGISQWGWIKGEREEAEASRGNLHLSDIVPRGNLIGGWNMT